MKVEEFIKSIEKEYLYFLYKKFNNIFPGCCHESSNLLCGFIQLFYDKSYVHKYISKVPYPHSYISNNSGIILDFTSFQYLHYRVKNGITKEELLDMARECECFPVSSMVYAGNYVPEDYINLKFNVAEIPCIYVEDISVIKEKYNEDDFLSYCEEYGEKVGDLVNDYLHMNF